jgi:hypothetical protein
MALKVRWQRSCRLVPLVSGNGRNEGTRARLSLRQTAAAEAGGNWYRVWNIGTEGATSAPATGRESEAALPRLRTTRDQELIMCEPVD